MPLIANETKKLKLQAMSLKTKMNELEKDISKTETSFSMANLERLDNLKTKLEAAKNFLEQNDTFSKLQDELEDILENDQKEDIGVACEKLHGLKKSYEAQRGLAGETERELKLEEFKIRIEAALTGDVIKILTDGDIKESLKYVEMFKKIDRLPQMKSYYGSLQQKTYFRHWMEIINALENTENPRFLNDFYEIFVNNWNKQIRFDDHNDLKEFLLKLFNLKFRWYREVFASDGVHETIQVLFFLLSSSFISKLNQLYRSFVKH